MGITPSELRFLTAAYKRGALPCGGDVLELGEAETIFIPDLAAALAGVLNDIDRSDPALLEKARVIGAARSEYQRRFAGAKLVYQAFLGCKSIIAVDGLPSPNAICIDLNKPCDLGRTFDVCINNGTSEHVFNLANVFKFMHDHTSADGIMIHYTPGFGWLDHGFYSIQPGFFFDLAAANNYEMLFTALSASDDLHELRHPDDAKLADERFADSLICTVLHKTNSEEFKIPYQRLFSSHEQLARFAAQNSGSLLALLPSRGKNIAIGRPTSQSSTSASSFNDDPEIDSAGGNNGRITGHYGFCTDLEIGPWWQVDLLQSAPIREIRVFNRLGNEAARANLLEIWLSDDAEQWVKLYSNEGRGFGGVDGAPLKVELSPPREARFIRLRLPHQEYLHLDEIEVYAVEDVES